MSYHTIHQGYEGYKIVVMGVLLAAFLIAMPLMFVHPTAVIMLVWSGLVILAVTVPIGMLIGRAERSAARSALRAHQCPECGTTLGADALEDGEWVCRACGSAFAADLG